MMAFFPEEIPELKGELIFQYENIEFSLEKEEGIRQWLKKIIAEEQAELHSITYIFCSDEYLHQVNVEYLNHDTYTDIITFPYSDDYLESDIFISIDRVKDNAQKFDVSFQQELLRVMIHGVLHLCGYGDKTDEEKKIMREKEEHAVAQYNQ